MTNQWRRFLWLSIGINYQYQSIDKYQLIDKLVSIGNDWLQMDGKGLDK